MKKKSYKRYLDNIQIDFTQRSIRAMIREAKSVLSRQNLSPSPSVSKSFHAEEYPTSFDTIDKKKLQRKSLIRKLSKSLKIKIPTEIRESQKYLLPISKKFEEYNKHCVKSTKGSEQAKQIKGIEDSLLNTKSKLKEKRKTCFGTPHNIVQWKKRVLEFDSKSGENSVLIFEKKKVKLDLPKKRKNTETPYTPWQTRDKVDSLLSIFPDQ